MRLKMSDVINNGMKNNDSLPNQITEMITVCNENIEHIKHMIFMLDCNDEYYTNELEWLNGTIEINFDYVAWTKYDRIAEWLGY